MERVFKHWNRLIKKVVESLTLERLKKQIDGVEGDDDGLVSRGLMAALNDPGGLST